MAKGSRLPGKEGVRVGVIPIAFTFLSMGTGEPDTSKVVCPVRGGTGRKGSHDLARGLPYLRSRFRQQLSASVRPLRGSDVVVGARWEWQGRFLSFQASRVFIIM